MQMKPGMLHQPGLDVWVLVHGVIVQDQMHRQTLRYLPVDGVQELEELHMPMLRQARPNDLRRRAGPIMTCEWSTPTTSPCVAWAARVARATPGPQPSSRT